MKIRITVQLLSFVNIDMNNIRDEQNFIILFTGIATYSQLIPTDINK